MRSFDYTRASSVDDAIAAHAQTNTVFLAGGTTLLDLMKLDVMRPARVVDIHKLALTQIEVLDDGRVRVGAMVSNTDLARHEAIRTRYPVLSQALLSGASTQLRNKATTAGNVMQRVRCGYFRDGVSPCNKRVPGSGCAAIDGQNRNVHAVLGGSDQCIAAHPSDMCVAMAAIGATVHVQGPNGVARDIDFLEFHRLPGDTPWKEHALNDGEMITHVTLDAPLPHSRSAYLKLRDRASYQFALASSAVIVVLDGSTIRDARIAMGGVGTKPWRAQQAEAVLKGQPATQAVFQQAAAAAMQGARSYGQNGFKIALGQQAIVRNLSTLVA
ncbi:FAD binding domain-containing protein [Paraburkholderia solisilvae]|uniref:Aldehyde oxidoreductase FAD-binding subunit PaoB n=1 Tax=Paraburkholderia solisilvae TaxID=624376 RepID=A0A6J5DDQ0_9BURK|nr:xanthine dehydrogenase family protein subunit M [Paraburkholderia solisilvae]CAB3751557.1 Aldehyde oxidoreductase FAD-binding subunit PaoB [Paraburkholderia solisilvae]